MCVCSKSKGSCKTYIDTCHTSDKGKGRGSSAVATSPTPRSQSSKKGSTTTFQPQKKHKVSLYYTKHKPSSAAASAAAMDEEHEDLTPDSLTPDSCNNNHPAFISEPEKKMSANFPENFQGDMEHSMSAAVMFPVEIAARFPEDVTLAPGPKPGLLLCSPVERSCSERYTEKINSEKGDISELEVRLHRPKYEPSVTDAATSVVPSRIYASASGIISRCFENSLAHLKCLFTNPVWRRS